VSKLYVIGTRVMMRVCLFQNVLSGCTRRGIVLFLSSIFLSAGLFSQEPIEVKKPEETKPSKISLKAKIEEFRIMIDLLKMERGDDFAPLDLGAAAGSLNEAEALAGLEKISDADRKITAAEKSLRRAKAMTEKGNAAERIVSAGKLHAAVKERDKDGRVKKDIDHAESVITEARSLLNNGSYRDAVFKVYEAEIILSSVSMAPAAKAEEKKAVKPAQKTAEKKPQQKKVEDKKAVIKKAAVKPKEIAPLRPEKKIAVPVKPAEKAVPQLKAMAPFKNLQFKDFALGEKKQNLLKIIEKNDGAYKKDDEKSNELYATFKGNTITFWFYKDVLYRMKVSFIVKKRDEFKVCMEHMVQKYGSPIESFNFGVGEYHRWESGGYSLSVTYFVGNYFDYFDRKKWSPEIHVEYLDTGMEKKDVEKDIRLKFKDL